MRSRRGALAPRQDTRPDVLSLREEEQLKRLLSDPTKYPQTLKTWIISWLEGSDLSLPLSAIVGLGQRLAAFSLADRSQLFGLAAGTTDAGGGLRVSFPVAVTGVQGVVLTNANPAHANCVFSAFGWDATGFTILAWNVPANAALAATAITVSWQAYVSP